MKRPIAAIILLALATIAAAQHTITLQPGETLTLGDIRITAAVPITPTVPAPVDPVVITPPIPLPISAIPAGFEVITGKDVTGLRLHNRNVALIDCTIRSHPGGWQQGHGIYYDGGSLIIRNLRATGDWRTGNALIAGYRGNVLIEDSVIDGGWQGIHLIGADGHRGNVTIRRTQFIRGYRYPIEIQSGWGQVLIEDVTVGDYAHVFRDSGLSIATPEAETVIVRRVTHTAGPVTRSNPSRPDSYEPHRDGAYNGVGGRFGPGLEVGGRDVLVEACEFTGPFVKAISVLSTRSNPYRTSATLRGNILRGWRKDMWGTTDAVVTDGGSAIANDWRRENDVR